MNLRNNIWYEMIDAKYGEIYLDKYISFNQNLIKTFNILTLILSISGIFSWKYFENYVWIVFLFIAILQLINLIKNNIIRNEKEVENIINLKKEYSKYHLKLEKLWFNLNNNKITENEAGEIYYKIKEKDRIRLDKLDSQFEIKKYKRLENKVNIEIYNYIKKFYYE